MDTKSVGLFVLLPAPLNPIGAFDAETFKANFRAVMAENADTKFIGADLSGIDFVYSDAYNAFMQFHQELSKRNGTFAVLADRESLAKSLRKVGLERFIRIFATVDEMASYVPVEQKSVPLADEPAKATEDAPVKPVDPAPQPASQATVAKPKIMDTNPLVDETSSSKGSFIAVILLLLIAAVVVSYLIL
jgi:anti-anti-sigma factor